jgi:TMEM175 potassium channel family protein
VSSGEDTPRARRPLGTGRMEAFSDGVFSIAATLLVLDIAIHPPGTPLEQVLHAWPGYLAYAVSFLTIGAGWLAHTALTDRLARTDPLLLRTNLALLLVVAFLPFPTKLVADALHHEGSERVFVTMYGLTLLAIRVLGFALDAYARHEHLYSPPQEGEEQTDEPRELLPVLGGYVVAILIGLAVPALAVVIYFAVAVYMILFPVYMTLFRELKRHPSRPR